MKKLLTMIVVVLLIATCVQAQDEPATGLVAKGFKAGIGIANFTGSDVSGTDSRMGFGGGGFVTFAVAPQFSVQPEVLFMQKGFKISAMGVDVDTKMGYLEIPVLFKYNVPTQGKLSPNLFAGPALGILLSASIEGIDVKDAFKSTDFGIAFGAGLDVAAESITVVFDVRYTMGVTDIPDPSAKVKNSNISFMAGIGF